jgi:hypothetical protein
MECQPIPLPRERDQVIMELIVGKALAKHTIWSLSQCQGALEVIFLLDMRKADGRYLEQFVFDPGGKSRGPSTSSRKKYHPKKTGKYGSTSGTTT